MTVERPPAAATWHPLFFRIVRKSTRSLLFVASATKHGRRDTVNEACASLVILELIELKTEKASG
jgi:hypothetical protein